MRDYSIVSPSFWTGETGRKIVESGPDCALVAMYLITSPLSNAFGNYYMPLVYISHATGIPIEGASKALRRVCSSGFCSYDDKTEVVWVHEMATFQIARSLKSGDKRVKWVSDEYEKLPKSPFLYDIFLKYKDAFHLKNPRGFEGASKPHRSQEQEQEQEQLKIKSVSNETLSSPDASVDVGVPGKDSVSKCPQGEIVGLWNQLMPELPHVRAWGDKSKSCLQARWKSNKEYQSLQWWEGFFVYIRGSDFLMGRKKEFKASLDWVVKPTNFEKIVNGNYENTGKVTTGSHITDQNMRAGEEFLNEIRRREQIQHADAGACRGLLGNG